MSRPAALPSFDEIKGYLNQIGHHLFKTDTALVPEQKPSAEQLYLTHLNGTLKNDREQFLRKSRALYQGLENSDLRSPTGQHLLATLKSTLNAQLLDMDLREQIDGKGRKAFMTDEAGFTAIGHEGGLGVQDRLMHPQARTMLDGLALGPTLRPGLYAVGFSYQAEHVELAGAFVVTQKNSPVVTGLMADEQVGQVVLFTPSRGIESFDSLADLDAHLLRNMQHAAGRSEFMAMLPTRYHALSSAGIWPLELSAIDAEPLFEHTYNARIDKRTQDIEQALSLADNVEHDPARLISALDAAIAAALPDLTARLELRAQALLERCLRDSAPDWYRSASETRRAALAEHLGHYDKARQRVLDLLGPAATAHTLARHQWLERLSDELEIHDLDPEHLHVHTRRSLAGFGEYEQQRSLIELALRGSHAGDELPGSDFRDKSQLTYNKAPLHASYKDLTPTWIAQQLATLQPRVAFAEVQKEAHARVEIRQAIEHLLDQRINALAYAAVLQNHLLDDDFQLIQRLRAGSDSRLSAALLGAGTPSLHGAQLKDLWVLRQTDASGTLKRLLLCTPEAPRDQQFQAFDSEHDCQQHILGWARDSGLQASAGSMADYLIKRLPLRFRDAMKQVLSRLTFTPVAPNKLQFNHAVSHRQCLQSMAEHVLATQVDDDEFVTPLWYRSTTFQTRKKLTTLAENTDGALRIYRAHAWSESRFPEFEHYVHEQARLRLNGLLGRSHNDVDPDTVWAHSPPNLVGVWTPQPITYTRLFRDGYADGVGFLDEKFSGSARFTGPASIDLSALTAENVTRSVTGVWIGQRYIDKLKNELLSAYSRGYYFRRFATLSITQWQMQSAAIECHLKGHIAGVDLQWLEQAIASMDDTKSSTRNQYAFHRLLIDGDWVIDAWLLRHADNPVLLYTPQAPDGISFREARLFNYVLKKQPGMLDYLTQRVGVQSRVRVRAFLEGAKRGLPEHLNSTTPSPARYDSLRRVAPVPDLPQCLYNMKLQRKIDDVSATTVNRTQMITDMLWTCVEWVAAVATAPFPVLSLSVGMLLAFKDAMLALHAYHQGDTSAALEHFFGYLLNSAGALVTDLRPALRTLKPISKPLRLATVGQEPARAMELISQLEPAAADPASLQPVFFNGQALWAAKNPDSIGRYLLYRLDPDSGTLISTSRLAAPNAEGVWVRSGVTGGAPKYESVPETPGPHKDYGLPAKHWRRIEPVLDPQTRANMMSYSADLYGSSHLILNTAALDLRKIRIVYLQQAERLTKDAERFFKDLGSLPARADVPPVEANTSLAQLISSDAFAGNRNLVIGAVPDSIASKQVLIMSLDALIEKGFKRLYLEYLPGDVFRLKLTKLNSGQSWRHIEQHLKTIDTAFGFAPDAEYSYLALVRKAREKGVSIMALDASTSYQLDDALLMGDIPPTTARNNSARNFYSHKVIEADAADAPEERWIALVDHSRMSTFIQTPGMADLQKAVALRIEDVGPHQPVGLWADTPGAIPGDPLAKGDYRMTLQTPYKAPDPVVPTTAAPLPHAQSFNDFDFPPSLRDDIDRLAGEPHGLDHRYPPTNATRKEAFDTFFEIRSKLKARAESFFADYAPSPRPTFPAIDTGITPESFLQTIGESRLTGLVIGEGHAAESSKALLRTQMKTIRDSGFKTLYVEHLFTDLHQAELDVFHRTQRLPARLKAYLRDQDSGHMPFYSGPNTYSQVIQAAAKYGLRVRALDCIASYRLKGLPVPTDVTRNQMFSYFATRVIQADQAANGPHKWIAFVGSAHTNNNLGVPGLAEMLGAASLHVRDTAPTLSKGIHPGYWETSINDPASIALRSDFKMEVGMAGNPQPQPIAPINRSRLSQAGHYLIDRPSSAEIYLVHRSSTGETLTTPIQVDDNGMFFIDRWGKQDKRFKHLNTLFQMLEAEINLTPAP
ncbi:membrane-targeted effector domain-containing toxin [Pseudomonas sp. dw_612]|uniref:membrane-targeted effector domain-containing toxin n=1 Tax=Pseudomonas sp. dw_612 TaxID=2720080 RepID=UPI001BD6BD63|nr:membrane-targeted effector domain-containing toxin [Pseudomonas sp. dw_612]